MKKSILNLGKALNKAEQKNVFGGNVITHYNPDCDGAHDGNYIAGCPCVPGTRLNTRVWTGSGWTLKPYTCS